FAGRLICLFCKLTTYRVGPNRFGRLCAPCRSSGLVSEGRYGNSDSYSADSCTCNSHYPARAADTPNPAVQKWGELRPDQEPCGADNESDELCQAIRCHYGERPRHGLTANSCNGIDTHHPGTESNLALTRAVKRMVIFSGGPMLKTFMYA